MEYIIGHQLNLMMVLGGICGFVFLFLLSMKIDSKKKKSAFLQIAFFAMVLLFADRLAYIYRGNETTTGYWMVRITNFLVFASIILCGNGFNNYLFSLAEQERLIANRTKSLKLGRIIVIIALGLLTISQFTGFYYSYDETNRYHRESGFIICYLMPFLLTALQLGFITKHRKMFRKKILTSLIVFMTFPLVASLIQLFYYGASLASISIAISAIVLYFLALSDQNYILAMATQTEIDNARKMKKKSQELLYQTVEALASAVDANDKYTHGHSNRVAKYSKMIAEQYGMTEAECVDVYLAGLLHDVGKLGISNSIINKEGKLSKEEFEIIKQHPSMGNQILSNIVLSPALSVGAHYHHERYDGLGYPRGLKGSDIPVIARIISVADAYDAMTSKRSYRDIIPQQHVREQLVMGAGTQFDPIFADYMIRMVDEDFDYNMKELLQSSNAERKNYFEFKEYYSEFSGSEWIISIPTIYTISSKSNTDNICDSAIPTLVIYDSLDQNVHLDNISKKEMNYAEYLAIRMDGFVDKGDVRNVKITKNPKKSLSDDELQEQFRKGIECIIEAVKYKDHVRVRIDNEFQSIEVIAALSDSVRYAYAAITGENCDVNIKSIDKGDKPISPDEIERIADMISYIDGPVGDVPNVQVDGWRMGHTKPIPVKDGTEIRFKSLSLPTARLIWHCPFIVFYSSDNNECDGDNYKEYALMRMDGESWCADIKNEHFVNYNEKFEGWDQWKENNKKGVNCKVSIERSHNIIATKTENSGVEMRNTTYLPEDAGEIYMVLTGDQCALTDIHISIK